MNYEDVRKIETSQEEIDDDDDDDEEDGLTDDEDAENDSADLRDNQISSIGLKITEVKSIDEVEGMKALVKPEPIVNEMKLENVDNDDFGVKNIFKPKQIDKVKFDPQKIYNPMDFDISLGDIALDPTWKDLLEPQVIFLKRKAEVFNRWKNDINFYFKSSS